MLDALSPLATFARGWSVTYDTDGAVLRDPHAVTVGDHLQTRVKDGWLHSTVTATNADEKEPSAGEEPSRSALRVKKQAKSPQPVKPVKSPSAGQKKKTHRTIGRPTVSASLVNAICQVEISKLTHRPERHHAPCRSRPQVSCPRRQSQHQREGRRFEPNLSIRRQAMRVVHGGDQTGQSADSRLVASTSSMASVRSRRCAWPR